MKELAIDKLQLPEEQPMTKHVLIVDDDRLLRVSLCLHLEHAGYRASAAASAEEALALVQQDRPDLILLDIGLPGMDGLEALRQFQQHENLPIIFVTARRRELDTIIGLEVGADSYITKPFNPDVLLAHVKAVLRRTARQSASHGRAELLTAGDLVIDPAARVVTLAGKVVDVTAREFDLLYVLTAEAGRVVSIDDLIDRAWGSDFLGEPQAIYVHIRWLREKLEVDAQKPTRIVNVRGVGYKLIPQTSPA
jgi:DNA-binding response OmpR family regulator